MTEKEQKRILEAHKITKKRIELRDKIKDYCQRNSIKTNSEFIDENDFLAYVTDEVINEFEYFQKESKKTYGLPGTVNKITSFKQFATKKNLYVCAIEQINEILESFIPKAVEHTCDLVENIEYSHFIFQAQFKEQQ